MDDQATADDIRALNLLMKSASILGRYLPLTLFTSSLGRLGLSNMGHRLCA
jgi:hypothetical protein